MIKSKNTLFWIIAIVVIIILALALWYFMSSRVSDPNKNNTPVPPGSPTPKWIPEAFPLNVGMYGSKIKALQKALGISQDGRFGQQTSGAIILKGKTVPLSETDYNAIVNPAATGGGSNFQELKNTLKGSQNFSGGIIYAVPGQNTNYAFNFYTNGRFFVNTLGKNDNLLKGTYYNGGRKMIIDGGKTYEGTPYTNMQNIVNDIGG